MPATTRTVAAAVMLPALLAGCAGGQTGASTGDSRFVAGDGSAQVIEAADRKAGPRVTGTTLEDRPFDLATLRGKVVVVNFWASWCAPCRGEAPTLEKMYEDHRAGGVEFVGVDIKDGKEPAKAFQRNFKVTYPSLFDPDGRVTLAFRDVPPNAVPSTLILDRRGRVAVRVIGAVTHSKLNPLLTRVVAEK